MTGHQHTHTLSPLTVNTWIKYGWGILHHPPFTSDFLLCDFHLVVSLKEHFGGKKSRSNYTYADKNTAWEWS
jgi:hypothetical protein